MKALTKHFGFRQATVVLLILGLTACSDNPDPEMPTFRGRFSGTSTTVFPGEDGSLPRCNANASSDGKHPGFALSSFGEGTGRFNLLGPVTSVSSECINPRGKNFEEGRTTLTTASGDVLKMEFHGSTSTNTGDPDIWVQSAEVQIVGGTGEFAQAHGTFTCRSRSRFSTGELDGTCRGDVSL